MAGDVALLASFFTLAGDIHPFRGRAISPVPLRARIEAAGKAGFRGFGFGKDDLQHSLASWSYADIATMLQDNGIGFSEVELLRNWFSPDDPGSLADRRFLLEAAANLGARHIKVGSSGPDASDEQIGQCFATLCDQAREAGTAIVLEISPIGRIATLERGQAVVAAANRPNGGLLLDLWHVVRGELEIAAIAQLAAGIVSYAELCDGPPVAEGNYIDEAVDRRLPCGEGAFPVEAFVAALRASGYDGPFGVEILSDDQRGLSASRAAERAFAGTAAVLSARRSRADTPY
jgi:sugar phosphate isomerase/epimerase